MALGHPHHPHFTGYDACRITSLSPHATPTVMCPLHPLGPFHGLRATCFPAYIVYNQTQRALGLAGAKQAHHPGCGMPYRWHSTISTEIHFLGLNV